MRKFIERVFGTESDRILKALRPRVAEINAFEAGFLALSDDALRERTKEFKARLAAGETIDSILPEAFAVVREASRRTTGMRHFDVQMIGGMVLHQGHIAEMRTGEGKTLVATLPVYLNALSGKGVHVITVNDYLARRDAEWMGQIYYALGLSVGVLNDMNRSFLYDPSVIPPSEQTTTDAERDAQASHKTFDQFLRPVSRRQAYGADITYGTNAQFGFDYLRDNTQYTEDGMVQRGHHFAIVDEVDSVLIDEARVPLILSTMAEEATDLYKQFAQLAGSLNPELHYTVDEKQRAIQLTDAGIARAEELLDIGNIYTPEHVQLIHHLETAVRARALFHRDQEYVVRGDEIIIVDPFTGRMQEGRRYSDGLHQAIEAKEGVRIQQESKTLASITYQNYFKLYGKLAGMTGTAKTSAEEFNKVYGLEVVEIPTNKPQARIDHNDLIFQTENGKFKAIARHIKELHTKGQPVLVGTVSIEKNEALALYLRNEGIPHEVLNAKNHVAEAEIVAQAGRRGAVTIATNMAGRGVDIKLGGPDATPEMAQEIRDLGGLHVIGTERHEARRIDNQLRGRAGRQGDPGDTQFYVSLEDQLMRVFAGDRVKAMIGSLGIAEDEPIQNSFITRSLESAQEKIEGFHFDSRKNILAFDDVLAHHRTVIYERRRKILESDRDYLDGIVAEVGDAVSELREKIQAKKKDIAEDVWYPTVRRVALVTIDRLWMNHLETMDHARQSVNLRAYGQREPIVEYKKESLRLYRELERSFSRTVADILAHLDVHQSAPQNMNTAPAVPDEKPDGSKYERNEKVLIEKEGKTQEVKYKNLPKYLSEGWTVVMTTEKR